jgi:hypothetical protein
MKKKRKERNRNGFSTTALATLTIAFEYAARASSYSSLVKCALPLSFHPIAVLGSDVPSRRAAG